MAEPKQTHLTDTVTLYEFAAIGDMLPLHHHGPGGNPSHFTAFLRGRFIVRGDFAGAPVRYGAGQVVNWPETVNHEFEAETDDARFVNVQKPVIAAAGA